MTTSKEAYESLDVTKIGKRVFNIIKDHPYGIISDEIRKIYIIKHGPCRDSTVTGRYSELKRKKLIEVKTDDKGNKITRKGESKRNQWVLVPTTKFVLVKRKKLNEVKNNE